jgi:hypothetical protein
MVPVSEPVGQSDRLRLVVGHRVGRQPTQPRAVLVVDGDRAEEGAARK